MANDRSAGLRLVFKGAALVTILTFTLLEDFIPDSIRDTKLFSVVQTVYKYLP